MAVAQYQGKDPGLLAVKDKIVKLVVAGDTAPLTPRYKPDAFSVNDPELVTMAVAHYLKAFGDASKSQENVCAVCRKDNLTNLLLSWAVLLCFPTLK